MTDATQTRSRTFSGAVPGEAATPQLVQVLAAHAPHAPGGRHLLRATEQVLIGRGEGRPTRAVVDGRRTLRLFLADGQASSHHVSVAKAHGRWVIRDLGSKNGTRVNGRRVEQQGLEDGDLIEIGRTFLLYRDALLVPLNAPLDVVDRIDAWDTLRDDLARMWGRIEQVAPSTAPILVLGETGTGKEVAAQQIHALSGRTGACVAVNCAAIPDELAEAEFFGHRAGAFTGAGAARPGRIRSAVGGTLFLDEIGDLAPAAQAVLLRALETRQVVPVGADRPVPVDFRLVAATHVDLDAAVAAGRFRADLRARLGQMVVALPPLRERRTDLGLLIRARLEALDSQASLSTGAALALLQHAWPGNVRELVQVLELAELQRSGGPIERRHLPATLQATPTKAPAADHGLSPEEQAERADLIAQLAELGGNVTALCRRLDLHRVTLYRRFRRLGIDPAAHRGR